ncbi:hypothetical protein TSA1_31930 [Bradyrhizobium nitroreducens]|uniref:Uncharacterized protein n=1 Tax=Bradyrhizobium nitroreducens TaxID=709803 RepID=A0A2M6UJV1_9BRAD|nr:hypothetical protein [Bradyrhizobium nitroreducens]PIT04848.1 hypothetical protein TSA1_31930 [Bradyrhizobium nitroreducens]
MVALKGVQFPTHSRAFTEEEAAKGVGPPHLGILTTKGCILLTTPFLDRKDSEMSDKLIIVPPGHVVPGGELLNITSDHIGELTATMQLLRDATVRITGTMVWMGDGSGSLHLFVKDMSTDAESELAKDISPNHNQRVETDVNFYANKQYAIRLKQINDNAEPGASTLRVVVVMT